MLALVVNDVGFGDGVLGHQQVRGACGEPPVERAQRLARGLPELFRCQAGLGRVGGCHGGERGRLDERRAGADPHPRALPVAERESGNLDRLGRVARGGRRLEVYPLTSTVSREFSNSEDVYKAGTHGLIAETGPSGRGFAAVGYSKGTFAVQQTTAGVPT